MRRLLLFSLLLAGAAATPALADPGDHSDRGDRAEHHADRAERQAARTEHIEMRAQQPHFGGFTQSQQNVQPVQQVVQQNTQTGEIQEFRARGQHNADGSDGARHFRMQRQQETNGAGEAFEGGTLRQSSHGLPPVMQPRTRSPMVSDTPREGTQPPLRTENHFRSHQPQWSTNWRNDHRYDWRNWRRHHHSLFHFGFYSDPFGWGYQPFSIGWRLWPSYYSSNYWLSDPYEYRLPFAPPGTRWIRYYNDALLVDMYTGEVVDVIRDFFW